MTRWLRFSTRDARVGEVARRDFGLAALLREPRLGRGKFLLGVADPALQFLDLRAHRDQLDLAAVGHHRAVVELGVELAKLALLVGQRLFGEPQRLGLGGVLFLGGAKLFLHRLLARFQRKDRGVLLAELDLHAVDRIGLLAEIGELAGGAVLELLDAHLEPPRRHREFRAQLVLVGLDLRHRQRRCGLEPARGQPHGAVMHQRHDHQAAQHRDQETDRQIHDRFDHETLLPQTHGE